TDIDFQNTSTEIHIHWKGFNDPHSGMAYYEVGLGTRPFVDNVESIINVGLREDFKWLDNFQHGTRYYATVNACNNAGLCQKRTSNGIVIDPSPPIQGLVSIGSGSKHHRYVANRGSVTVQWVGFQDPESGLDHFDICIGDSPSNCKYLPYKHCQLRNSIVLTGLSLPENINLFVTVRAFNKAKIFTNQTSDYFRIDTTAPVIFERPQIRHDMSGVSSNNGQWERSLLKLKWKFEDKQSPIVSHILTLKTHHDGHTPVEYLHVGNIDKLTISLHENDLLNNGDKYFVTVTGCNLADLCTEAISENITVDSSPPHVGGFKPPLNWNTFKKNGGEMLSNVTLTWYGFIDPESEIESYFITLSRTYSGNELSNETIVVTASNQHSEMNTSITLVETIKPDDIVIISIWAMNKIGLNSSVSRTSVLALSGSSRHGNISTGRLELVKHSCDVHFCNSDCTCAVFGKPCTMKKDNITCNSMNVSEIANELPTLRVVAGLTETHEGTTASSNCLSGNWNIISGNESAFERYEWSAGLTNQPIGEGIYDLSKEMPWKDVGKRNQFVYCLPDNKTLLRDNKYVIYVRVWYNYDHFGTYISPTILIDTTPPQQSTKRKILDSNEDCQEDVDVLNATSTVTCCWNKVFKENQSKIAYFEVALGTSPNGKHITFNTSSLLHGTRYYCTVSSYNILGLHTTGNSDGFMIDIDIPIQGTVFNTRSFSNRHFQSSTTEFEISWYGFTDHLSGIRSYEVAYVEASVTNYTTVNFQTTGLQTNGFFRNITLQQGMSYKGLVKAIDGAGHESEISVSASVTIDSSAPTGYICRHWNASSLPISNNSIGSDYIQFNISCERYKAYRINGISDFCLDDTRLVLQHGYNKVPISLVKNYNRSYAFEYNFLCKETKQDLFSLYFDENAKSDSIHLNISECDMDIGHVLDVVKVRQIGPSTIRVVPFILDRESGIRKWSLGIGTTENGYQLQTFQNKFHGSDGIVSLNASHGTSIFVTVIVENNAGLTSTLKGNTIKIDRTPPDVVEIKAEFRASDLNDTIFARWSANDEESGIAYCSCGLGNVGGQSDIIPMQVSDSIEGCKLVAIENKSEVFVNVVCVNGMELETFASTKVNVIRHVPTTDDAIVNVVPLNEYSPTLRDCDETTCTQSNQNKLCLEWTGFQDVRYISGYEYRILVGNFSERKWSPCKRHTFTEVNIRMQENVIYTAEVRAINRIGHSAEVSKDIRSLPNGPGLTGQPVKTVFSNSTLFLDWQSVFEHTEFELRYDVMIGSQSGYTDLLELQNTGSLQYTVPVPTSTIVSPVITELHITINAIGLTGFQTRYGFVYRY
ncbi:hypothetical protein MAR_034277, partial [Mya arenaria]